MRRLVVLVLVVGLSFTAGCAGDGGEPAPRSIVVTTAVLGAVVGDLVGEAADVTVLVPNGTDPHEWEPSAKDVERLNDADLLVVNGLDLEAKLVEAVAAAESDGVVVFRAADRLVAVSPSSSVDDGHGHVDGDPHFWVDPTAMAVVVAELTRILGTIGIDVSGESARVEAELESLDRDVASMVDTLSADRRVLVTGHESLGWFAAHYGFTLVGSIVPGFSSAADVTAANLSDLKKAIEATGTTVIFTELGTPADVARALADETGTRVVELATHLVPADGTYRSFLLELASTIVDSLGAAS